MPTRCYLAGLDIGFQQDYTVLVICEVFVAPGASRYVPVWIERLPLPTTAPQVQQLVGERLGLGTAWQRGRDRALLDVTGAGLPLLHQIQRERLDVLGVWCHSGTGSELQKDGRWNVSKQDLIGSVKLVVEQARLQLDPTLPFADTLLHELQSYRMTHTTTGQPTYASWN